MTIGQAIGYKMLQTTAITSIVGTRVYEGDIPATLTTYPQINYFCVSAPFIGGNAERERWQINCRAKTVEAAKNLAYLVRNCFNEFQGSAGTSFDFQMSHFDNMQFFNEGNQIYNCPVDIFFTYIRT